MSYSAEDKSLKAHVTRRTTVNNTHAGMKMGWKGLETAFVGTKINIWCTGVNLSCWWQLDAFTIYECHSCPVQKWYWQDRQGEQRSYSKIPWIWSLGMNVNDWFLLVVIHDKRGSPCPVGIVHVNGHVNRGYRDSILSPETTWGKAKRESAICSQKNYARASGLSTLNYSGQGNVSCRLTLLS